MAGCDVTPSPGQIARVRQRLYLVEQTVAAAKPRRQHPGSTVLRGRRRPRAAPGSALGTGDRHGDQDRRSVGGRRQAGLRSASTVCCLPEHPPVELRHRHRPSPVPVAVPGRHPTRCLPARTAPQGPAPAAGQSFHRRRRWAWARRSRPGSIARELLPAQEGPRDRRLLPAVHALAVAGRAGSPLRTDLRDSRQGLHDAGSGASGATASTPGVRTRDSSSRTGC